MEQLAPGEQQRPQTGSSAGGGGGGRTGEALRAGGYNSDSEGAGPVLKGVTHTAGHGGTHEAGPSGAAKGSGGGGPSAGAAGRHGHTHGHGDSDRSAAVVAGEDAAAGHKHAVQGG